jgi:seryl-tRNA synthetase
MLVACINISIFVKKINNMLQVNYIRENREEVIAGLTKKNFKQLALIDQIIQFDEQRRALQVSSDTLAAEANAIAKQIGEFNHSTWSRQKNSKCSPRSCFWNSRHHR